MSRIKNKLKIMFFAYINNFFQISDTTAVSHKNNGAGFICNFLFNIIGINAEIFVYIRKYRFHVFIKYRVIGGNKSNRSGYYLISVIPTVFLFQYFNRKM